MIENLSRPIRKDAVRPVSIYSIYKVQGKRATNPCMATGGRGRYEIYGLASAIGDIVLVLPKCMERAISTSTRQ